MQNAPAFSTASFGEFIRSLRINHRLGLREFCAAAKVDPSNWSKIERGALKAPTEPEVLERCATALQIEPESPEWKKLFDLAYVDAGRIPEYVLNDKELAAQLPVFFRTLKGEKPKREDLVALSKLLRKAR